MRKWPRKQMDSTDRKILMVLQQDATLAVADVAEMVGLSQTPCWRRIQKLRASGVIERTVAILDPDKIGCALTVFVSVEAPDHSPEWFELFTSAAAAMPMVLEFYRMAGDVDYLLRVAVRDMAEFDAFYREMTALVPLKNVTSRFAMERIKSTTAYPINP